MELILIILYTIGAATFAGVRDAAETSGKEWHTWGWWSRAYNAACVVFMLPVCVKITAGDFSLLSAWVHPMVVSILLIGFLLCVSGAVFWIWFDLIYNGQRGGRPSYVGDTSRIDRIMKRSPFGVIVTKLFLLVSFVALYLIV